VSLIIKMDPKDETKEEAPKEEAANLSDMFGEKKKKRKVKKDKPAEESKDKAEPVEESNTTSEETSKDDDSEETPSTEPIVESGVQETRAQILAGFPKFIERDYSYEELVARLFGLIQRPEEKTTVKIKPPIVHKEGAKKTAWANFPQICASINRQPEHVMQFVLAECASTGSVDGSGKLLIRGRFQQKHIERILRSYIIEYIQCHTCKSLETKLEKENRLLFMKCDTCGSVRSVSQIKTGFQAVTRATRRTEKAKV